MTTTEKVVALMQRLKIEMNGAVTEAMRDYSGGQQGYGLNYGVSLPTIKEVAAQYAPDHELAMALWRQDVRELKLAALFIDDPTFVTKDQMEAWAGDWRVPELAEQSAMQLFWQAPEAFLVAAEWAALSPDTVPFKRLAASYMLGRLASRPAAVPDDAFVALFETAGVFGPAAIERSVSYALREIYRHRVSLRPQVLQTLDQIPSAVADEVRWQVEYLG